MKIAIASSNKEKIEEIKDLLNNEVEILSPKDLDIENFEVDEDKDTLKGNSYKKAKTLFDRVKIPTMADDTGLFVNALDGRPGVKAHRYASEDPTYKENRDKLIGELEDKNDRSAYFKSCICYIDQDGKDYYFEGIINGTITKEEHGDYDFGYDQIFKPDGSEKTFGQMTVQEKNDFSHRAIAVKEFGSYLKDRYKL
jgi:XTP/dITP diphosphohydrolase